MSATQKTLRALLIDIGNTNLKWCWLEGGVLSETYSMSHKGMVSDESIESYWQNEKPPNRVLIACVAREMIQIQLVNWIRENWKVSAESIRSQASLLGVTNAYQVPQQLGVDRWLTLIATHRSNSCACCIVDCGTAITVDVIEASGRHLGGLILPGIDMMREALREKTDIPSVAVVEAKTLLGRDTASAIASAAVNSAAALIERALNESTKLLGEQPLLVLTGSGAIHLMSALYVAYQHEPNLVMFGLRVLALET